MQVRCRQIKPTNASGLQKLSLALCMRQGGPSAYLTGRSENCLRQMWHSGPACGDCACGRRTAKQANAVRARLCEPGLELICEAGAKAVPGSK